MGQRCDEIGELALRYLAGSRDGAASEIEAEIARALAAGEWDAASKWHRVRLRLHRLREEARRTGELRAARPDAQPGLSAPG